MTSRRAKVVAVGSANIDLVASVSSLPGTGETIAARSVARAIGGKGVNGAVAARRMGARTHLVATIGDDRDGDDIAMFLFKEDINTDLLHRDARPTGLAVVTVDAAGRNTVVVASGANLHPPTMSDHELGLRAGDVVIAPREVPDELLWWAGDAARRSGSTFILNPSPAEGAPPELIAAADVVVVNEHELAHLTGAPVDPGDGAAIDRAARSLSCAPVVVTLGAGGVRIVDGDLGSWVPAPRVCAVDTTGAGDCFLGSMAARLVHGDELLVAVRWAVVAAAEAVTRCGSATAMPTLDEVRRHLAVR